MTTLEHWSSQPFHRFRWTRLRWQLGYYHYQMTSQTECDKTWKWIEE